MSNERVLRYISVFERAGDAHVRDIHFSSQPLLHELQSIFSVGADDPMYDEYPIDATIASRLTSVVRERFDFERFEYFLSCDVVT
ncbi:hypothetical protein F3J14_05045 [Burkholderia sp. Tr-862]|uniref:DUF7683 domain-containing protein n=1 Tax=Burkholderia sp. Tr-862 TaxID=2608331 RepID=UPI001419F754|nr:hypothetical protein [Burkholderia sp. Tr-862]NIF40282.1 hypothetical protein [Burkholderia sp. Tr-862]